MRGAPAGRLTRTSTPPVEALGADQHRAVALDRAVVELDRAGDGPHARIRRLEVHHRLEPARGLHGGVAVHRRDQLAARRLERGVERPHHAGVLALDQGELAKAARVAPAPQDREAAVRRLVVHDHDLEVGIARVLLEPLEEEVERPRVVAVRHDEHRSSATDANEHLLKPASNPSMRPYYRRRFFATVN